jgi:hypothetical protein
MTGLGVFTEATYSSQRMPSETQSVRVPNLERDIVLAKTAGFRFLSLTSFRTLILHLSSDIPARQQGHQTYDYSPCLRGGPETNTLPV